MVHHLKDRMLCIRGRYRRKRASTDTVYPRPLTGRRDKAMHNLINRIDRPLAINIVIINIININSHVDLLMLCDPQIVVPSMSVICIRFKNLFFIAMIAFKKNENDDNNPS